MRILDTLTDPRPAEFPPDVRLLSGAARWADRHHPLRAVLRAYHRAADALYWADRASTMEHMNDQARRLELVRDPVARAARGLHRELGDAYEHMADDLTGLWGTQGVKTVLPSGTVLYQIGYAAWLVREHVEEIETVAVADPDVARVLATYLDRPGAG